MGLFLKRALTAGIANLVLGFGLNFLYGFILPTLKTEYQNPAIFRPWSDPLMMLFFLHPFILGLTLAFLWEKVSDKLGSEKSLNKSLNFAKICFIVATIPGMFVSYTTFQISGLMVLSWTITGVLETFISALIFTKIKK